MAYVVFPSPYGDFVFQQSSASGRKGASGGGCFRPLTGILFFNVIYPEERKKPPAGHRFRPLTGILFFNNYGETGIQGKELDVSVPLRGFCFST